LIGRVQGSGASEIQQPNTDAAMATAINALNHSAATWSWRGAIIVSAPECPPDGRLANVKISGQGRQRLAGRVALGDHAALPWVESGRTAERHAALSGPANAFVAALPDQLALEFG